MVRVVTWDREAEYSRYQGNVGRMVPAYHLLEQLKELQGNPFSNFPADHVQCYPCPGHRDRRPTQSTPVIVCIDRATVEEFIHPEDEIFDPQDVLRVEAQQLQDIVIRFALIEEFLGPIK